MTRIPAIVQRKVRRRAAFRFDLWMRRQFECSNGVVNGERKALPLRLRP